MLKMRLQYFGGRGAGSGGGGTGGVDLADVQSTTSLISDRERHQKEVDQVMSVMRDVENRYGVIVTDAQVATLGKGGAGTMAYYDSNGNLAINEKYFDAAKMDSAYDKCVEKGFHPSRNNKTGLEAVTAHEMGHRLTDEAGVRAGNGQWNLDKTSNEIVKKAAQKAGYTDTKAFTAKISGYAKQNHAEAIAEAFSDVYCNGKKAARESKAIVDVLNTYF